MGVWAGSVMTESVMGHLNTSGGPFGSPSSSSSGGTTSGGGQCGAASLSRLRGAKGSLALNLPSLTYDGHVSRVATSAGSALCGSVHPRT